MMFPILHHESEGLFILGGLMGMCGGRGGKKIERQSFVFVVYVKPHVWDECTEIIVWSNVG